MISIIIPTLNEEKYIESTLKALKNQDYKEKYEIIVADGMSRDNTVRIAKKYADKVILVKKKGIAEGRNAGAKVAKGDILLFIDADTILLSNGLSELTKPFEKKSVVGSTCYVLPVSQKIHIFLHYWIFNLFMKRSIDSGKPELVGLCCVYRRNIFEKVKGFNENLDTLEDFDLSKRISKLGKIVLVNTTFVLTSHRRIEKWGEIRTIEKYLKLFFNYRLRGKVMSTKEYKSVR